MFRVSRKSRVFRLSKLNALSCIARSCSEGEQICNDDLTALAKAVAVAFCIRCIVDCIDIRVVIV